MVFDIEMIKKVYQTISQRVEKARALNERPLTLSEKILYSHLFKGAPDRGLQKRRFICQFCS